MTERYNPPVDALRPSLVGMSREALQEALAPRADAKWRAKQVAAWIYGKAETDLDRMGDLPKALREELARRYDVSPLHVATHRKSAPTASRSSSSTGATTRCTSASSCPTRTASPAASPAK